MKEYRTDTHVGNPEGLAGLANTMAAGGWKVNTVIEVPRQPFHNPSFTVLFEREKAD